MPQNISTIRLANGRLSWSSDYPAAKPELEGPFAAASWSQHTRSLSLTLPHATSTGQLVGSCETPTWGSLEEEQINTSGKAVMTWIVPNKVRTGQKLDLKVLPFPIQSAHSWKPDETGCLRKEQSSGKNTGLRRCGTQILVLPQLTRSPKPWSRKAHLQMRLELGIRIKSKLHRIWNPLKAMLPSLITDFYFRVKRERGDEEIEKNVWLQPLNAKPHPSLWCCSLSCMTGHPGLPGISPVLALKVPHPGNPQSWNN